MRGKWIAGVLGILIMIVCPTLAFANGFAINEQGAKALGMGGAFVAQADDPTAVYFNPAGITQLSGSQVSLGMSAISPDAKFESSTDDPVFYGTSSGDKTNLRNHTFFVPNAYFTQQYNDRLSFGLGVFANWGLRTEWPKSWPGRFIPGGTDSELKTASINPVIAFKPWDRVSVGFGAVLQYFEFELKSKQFANFNPVTGEVTELDTKFKGDDWGGGWNVGLLVELPYNFKFGASYRSQVNHTISDGDLKFSPQVPGVFFNTNLRTSFKTPAIGYLGLAWSWGPLTLEFDTHWTNWSSFSDLSADFDDLIGGKTSLQVTENYHDAWAYRFGTQYRVNEYFDVRAGLIYDESPIPDKALSPRIPSGDRWIYTVGFSGHYKKIDLDFAYNYLDDENRKLGKTAGEYLSEQLEPILGPFAPPPLEGKFKDVDAHIFALNITYRF
ncbi:MAG: outer membrane protein transport protein [Deltaproteobacteria bacterium]|nr:outer membrane protein transport protein [Deltaproteobacteria bacterium]MBW2070674.1 outer membrane protein transport protein [Deltaproteobacteria bacterium]